MSGSYYKTIFKGLLSTASATVVVSAILHTPSIAKEVVSVRANNALAHSVPTQIVMKNILLEIGFTEDDMPNVGPGPTPDNKPKPRPVNPDNTPVKPEVDPKKEDRSFFDDNFFDNSSTDGKSFEEIKKDMEKEFADTTAAWQKEYTETVAKWAAAKKEYNTNIDKVAASTFDIESEMKDAPTLQNAASAEENLGTRSMVPGEFYLIPKSLDIKSKTKLIDLPAQLLQALERWKPF